MSSLNEIYLLGNIVRDPEYSVTQKGKPVCNLSLAVSNKFKDEEGKEIDKPLFIDVVIWNKQATATAEYRHKGDQIFIVGRLVLDVWDDEEGKKHRKYKVTAKRVIFGNRKKDDTQNISAGGAVPESKEASQPPLEENQ